MKKTLILLFLATTISCSFNKLLEVQEYIWPENVQELLTGKWLLTTSDDIDASDLEIIKEFRADSTYWTYSLLVTDSITPNPTYTWHLDKEAQLLKRTSYTDLGIPSWWYVDANGDSLYKDNSAPLVFGVSDYKINLITEETLVLKRTVDYVGIDPFYGSGGGTTNRPEETYVKIP